MATDRDTGADPSRPRVAARAVRSNVLLVPISDTDSVKGVASVFFVDNRGTLVSSYHALRHADSMAVIDANEHLVQRVELLAVDRMHDLVLLRVGTPVPAFLSLARAAPAVGETVYTVGNPLGQKGSFAEGVLSAVRALSGTETVTALQVSAPISQGSSGGAVLNERGEVVGVAARVSDDGEIVGFAVHQTNVVALLRSQRAPVLFTRRALAAWVGPDSVEYLLETEIDDQPPSKAGAAEAGSRVPTESLNYVQAQLRTRDSVAALIGYQPRRGIDFVSLPPFGTTTFSMALPPGSYQLIAVCDENGGDVDLQL